MRRTHDGIWLAVSIVLCNLGGCMDSGIGWRRNGSGICPEFDCWQIEQGTLERVGSWHEHEHAFRMNGTPARITRKFDASQLPACADIEITANVAVDAQLEFELDYGNDGIIDSRIPVEPGIWTKHSFVVAPPANTRHLRLALNKSGTGEVAIDYVELTSQYDCADVPRLTLGNGSLCLEDAACTSGRCVVGRCSACGAGGCAEGSACRDGGDCASGACAAGVCRACAASGSCGQGEGCSASSQCASRACVFGSTPSLTQYPELDGTCGECASGADCAGGHCVFGMCADCATDADCTNNLRCRYADPLEAQLRTCMPRFNGFLPRGTLCEEDIECELGLRCTGAAGRAKRCGGACASAADCGTGEVCASAGVLPSNTQAALFELSSAYANANARVQTCYPLLDGSTTEKCTVHAQCRLKLPDAAASFADDLSACCAGRCSISGVDLATDECRLNEIVPIFFW